MCSGCYSGSGNGSYGSSAPAQSYNSGSSAGYRNYSESPDEIKPQNYFDKFLYLNKIMEATN